MAETKKGEIMKIETTLIFKALIIHNNNIHMKVGRAEFSNLVFMTQRHEQTLRATKLERDRLSRIKLLTRYSKATTSN